MKNFHVLIQKWFVDPTDHWMIQLFRYTFVGGLSFGVDFGSLFVLKEVFHLYYLVAAAIAFVLGWGVNYIISTRWVFFQKKYKNRALEFILFGAIGLVGLGFNELFMYLLTDFLGLYYLVSKIVSTGGVYLWNFFARKFLLFSGQGAVQKKEFNKDSGE